MISSPFFKVLLHLLSLLHKVPRFCAIQEVVTWSVFASRLGLAILPMLLPISGSNHIFLGFIMLSMCILSIAPGTSDSNSPWLCNQWVYFCCLFSLVYLILLCQSSLYSEPLILSSPHSQTKTTMDITTAYRIKSTPVSLSFLPPLWR